jgi:hypothetical protein
MIASLVLLSSINAAYADKEKENTPNMTKSFYDFSFTAIDGTPLPLSNFKDKLGSGLIKSNI